MGRFCLAFLPRIRLILKVLREGCPCVKYIRSLPFVFVFSQWMNQSECEGGKKDEWLGLDAGVGLWLCWNSVGTNDNLFHDRMLQLLYPRPLSRLILTRLSLDFVVVAADSRETCDSDRSIVFCPDSPSPTVSNPSVCRRLREEDLCESLGDSCREPPRELFFVLA